MKTYFVRSNDDDKNMDLFADDDDDGESYLHCNDIFNHSEPKETVIMCHMIKGIIQ